MSEAFIKKVGPLATLDMRETGVLASVTIAQMILESGWGSTELAKNANNYFGMKTNLSGNTWESAWDGKSKYTKITGEQRSDGSTYYITADFRKYPDMETSVKDHSLYLLGSMNGNKKRYDGLRGERDYKKAIQIIKDGGYATDTKYVSKICNIIERYNLTVYDAVEEVINVNIIQNNNFKGYNVSERSGKIEYIVIHYLGADGTAKNNIDYFNGGNRQASADFFVGHSGEIHQYNPDILGLYSWHCGGGRQSSDGGSHYGKCKNSNSIGIEMCVKKSGSKWYFEDATVKSAIELVKYLMKKYNVPASRVIRHFDVTGKYCPWVYGWISPTGSEAKWREFKNNISQEVSTVKPTTKNIYRVRKSWGEASTQIGAYEILENAKKTADENRGYNVYDSNGKLVYGSSGVPFTVKVKIDNLNIRKGAGTNHSKVKYIKPGIYTIVEVKNGKGSDTGWGKLKSGLGWISLDYVERV